MEACVIAVHRTIHIRIAVGTRITSRTPTTGRNQALSNNTLLPATVLAAASILLATKWWVFSRKTVSASTHKDQPLIATRRPSLE
jgi:hypothetical protein